jgi:hypothetical protein
MSDLRYNQQTKPANSTGRTNTSSSLANKHTPKEASAPLSSEKYVPPHKRRNPTPDATVATDDFVSPNYPIGFISLSRVMLGLQDVAGRFSAINRVCGQGKPSLPKRLDFFGGGLTFMRRLGRAKV